MINPMDLTGRTVMVTGGSSGIGRDTAVLLAQLGARVILVARSEDKLKETSALLEGTDHVIAPFDLAEVDAIPGWMKEMASRAGPIHGLVHSAAIQFTRPLRMANMERIEKMMRVNVVAAMLLAKGFRQKDVGVAPGGSVVFLTSVMGMVGQPGQSEYSASKGALIGMVKSLACEWAGEGVRVNCVAPGLVWSGMGERAKEKLSPEQLEEYAGMHLLGVGEGRDVAYAVAFLLGDTGRWITGTTLVVDGGYIAH